jgi:hypothetical protein
MSIINSIRIPSGTWIVEMLAITNSNTQTTTLSLSDTNDIDITRIVSLKSYNLSLTTIIKITENNFFNIIGLSDIVQNTGVTIKNINIFITKIL